MEKRKGVGGGRTPCNLMGWLELRKMKPLKNASEVEWQREV